MQWTVLQILPSLFSAMHHGPVSGHIGSMCEQLCIRVVENTVLCMSALMIADEIVEQ